MLQELNDTIKQLQERTTESQAGDLFIPKFYETIVKYGSEVIRDLKEEDWQCQFNGGLSAGYLFCIMGESGKGIDFFDKSLQMHEENKSKYSDPESSILEFIVNSLEEFGADKQLVTLYKSRLVEAREKEEEKPEELRRKIIHIEADMECAVGDLDASYKQGRREQGLLYQKLGEHEKAIKHFQISLDEDRRDWRRETSIKNKLLIVDSYLALNDRNSAVKEFMALMNILIPEEIKEGEPIPELFTENFPEFYPYFGRLGIDFETIARYSKARLESLKGLIKPPAEDEKPEEHWKRSELCDLLEILALYHVNKGEFQQASDIFDEGRKYLEYKNHLSMKEQAEFAIRAGNPKKALELIKEEEAERGDGPFHDDERTDELTNLYLQLGDFESALGKLEEECDRFKGCLVSGSYEHLYRIRRTQIEIFKAAIGKDYVQKLREYAKGKSDLFPKKNLKFLPKKKDKQ